MVRPERFELPTPKFVAWYSIQLSYGRVEGRNYQAKGAYCQAPTQHFSKHWQQATAMLVLEGSYGLAPRKKIENVSPMLLR